VTYLNPIRLHFAGQFQADPSTVNNEVRHYDTSQFQPGWQQLEADFDPTTGAYTNPNGWWNPDGSGSFRLVGCTVTSVAYLDVHGSPTTSTTDSIVGMQIMGANTRVAGKLVDLDPQQQMVSQIWGMLVRLTNGTTDLFSGSFAAAPFTDMWSRAQGPGSSGDIGASAVYQSVIGPVTWGDPGDSTLLQQLIAAAPDGLLSIKFNVDSYNMNIGTPGFTLGRCVGTIGPASPSEPQFFTLGRHLMPSYTFNQVTGPTPVGPMYFMPCALQGSTLYADFGNALPTTTPGSDMAPIGTVQLGTLDANDNFTELATLENYASAGWYEQTAGIQAFTIDPPAIQSNRLAVSVAGTTTLMENTDGLYVRADNFVYRLNANEAANVTVWGTQYGIPIAGIAISVAADPTQLQTGPEANDPLTNSITIYDPAQPANIISFPGTLTTAANGQATLTINTINPNTPRVYMDGQVFGVRCLPAATAAAIGNPPAILSDQNTPMTAFGFDPWDFVSLLVWDEYDQPATWANVAPILAQYAVLYPVMDQLIDLTSETEVNQQAALLQLVFGLPVTDPNSMPVTRDLSDAKRAMLLQYLGAQVSASPSPTVVGAAPHGKPVMIRRKVAAASPPSAAPDAGVVTTKDSKTLALRNRLGNRRTGNK
jgi:hypothetical protein